MFFTFWELQAIGSSSQNIFKSANLVLLTKFATETDWNLAIKIEAASFGKDIVTKEVWKDFGFFEARKSDYLIETVNFLENTLIYLNQAYLTMKKEEQKVFFRP